MRLGGPDEATAVLKAGGLVVIPTETVYGLAAAALDPEAVARIFAAKGRPTENPLIVHVAGPDAARELVTTWPDDAQRLAEAFWPGPLTLILPKSAVVPAIVTAGLETVALRAPAHPMAQAVLAAAGIPLAAPSANRFGRTSPTRVEHLDPNLLVAVEVVVDGGPCEVGIESTVLDLTTEPRLLRAGGVPRTALEDVLRTAVRASEEVGARRSPGNYSKHYAPRNGLRLVSCLSPDQAGITFETPCGPHQIQLSRDPREYASQLYHALHALDALDVPLYAETPPEDPEWEAIRDRLVRAAG